MHFDQVKFAFKVLDQRGAILHPVAAVHVSEAVHVANFRLVNVPANYAVHPVLARILDQRVLVIAHVFHGALGGIFHVAGERPVAKSEATTDAIED